MIRLSPLNVECTLFFQENPYTFETASGLANRLGRNVHELTIILEQLVVVAILERIGEGEQAIYRYIQPENKQFQREVLWD